MKTKIQKLGNTINIQLDGTINYEAQELLKQDLRKIVKAAGATDSTANIVIDMQSLKFVGSSHISMFVQALKDFHERSNVKPRIVNVSSEFKKVFKAFDENSILDYLDVQSGNQGSGIDQ